VRRRSEAASRRRRRRKQEKEEEPVERKWKKTRCSDAKSLVAVPPSLTLISDVGAEEKEGETHLRPQFLRLPNPRPPHRLVTL
jgi:hypothetical protein